MKNKLKGGKSDNMTIKDIANKFNVPVSDVKKQITKGEKVESEHTTDKGKQTEIATDHVSEFPDYYDRLEKLEKDAEKYWKSKMTESKKSIKNILRENLNSPSIKQQIYQQIQKLGLDPNEVDINLNHKPMSYDVQPELEEGAKSYIGKALITCLIGASGLVSCKKAEHKFMYKYSYKDSRIDKEHLNPNLRGSCFFAYDHILTPAEIAAEEDKIEVETEKTLNIDIVDGTDKLEFEEEDHGQWG
jgi:hypothetical protein